MNVRRENEKACEKERQAERQRERENQREERGTGREYEHYNRN